MKKRITLPTLPIAQANGLELFCLWYPMFLEFPAGQAMYIREFFHRQPEQLQILAWLHRSLLLNLTGRFSTGREQEVRHELLKQWGFDIS